MADSRGSACQIDEGMSYRPLTDTFVLSDDLSVNYIASAAREGECPPTKPEFELP